MMIVPMNIKPRQLEIIEATGKLLTTSGINGLTIKNLASEMNFSESAIYRHFSSKEEIIVTLLKYLNENVNTIFKESSISGVFEKDFTALFKELTYYFKENPFYVVVVFSEGLVNESAQRGEKIIQLMNSLTKHAQESIK
ncbi:MAG: TetR/AcrR family transcriptional regulator, partial [Petrimonas sp.]|nr:TetR/AcrR family transcriptional regulator [Petrimonas sp.]